jgi:hypothetical protein
MKANHPSNAGGPALFLVTIASATLGALLLSPCFAASTAPAAASRGPAPARATRPHAIEPGAPRPDSSESAHGEAGGAGMTMHGGEDGTVFRTLTIEGEDRIHIEVERPLLRLGLDPEKAPGLDLGSALDVLDRTAPDALAPLLDLTARDASPWVARPWLAHFASGPVARVRPDVKGVEQWKLTVVDERGGTAATWSGRGNPPEEIDWDGRRVNGEPVQPGVTYSYVFEAHDRAGNRRNFVGEGFRVSAFRVDMPDGPVLLFTGAKLRGGKGAVPGAAPPIVLEAATALNRVATTARRVRVEVTARGADEAAATAQRLGRWLAPMLIGDPARIECVPLVRPDAPAEGSIRIFAVR